MPREKYQPRRPVIATLAGSFFAQVRDDVWVFVETATTPQEAAQHVSYIFTGLPPLSASVVIGEIRKPYVLVQLDQMIKPPKGLLAFLGKAEP